MKTQAKSAYRCALYYPTHLALLFSAITLHGAPIVWDGGGADTNMSTATNWAGDVVPVASDAWIFSGTTRTGPVNDLTANTSVDSISFTNNGTPASAFTLTGNAITLSGTNSITTTASSTQITNTSSIPLVLTAGLTVDTSTNHNLTLSGLISGTGTLVKNGAGTLQLSSATANTYNGGTTLNAGTLLLGSTNVGVGTGTLTLNAGTLASNNTFGRTLTNAVTIGGDVNLGNVGNTQILALNGAINLGSSVRTISTSSVSTLGGVVSGAGGGIIKTGASTLILGSANTFTGGVTLSEGSLAISNASALGGGTFTFSSGGSGTFSSDGASSRSVGNAVNLAGNAIVRSGVVSGDATDYGDITFTGLISGTGSITKEGTNGVLRLDAANTFTGGLVLNGGTLTFAQSSVGAANAVTSSPIGTGTLTINNTGIIRVSGAASARSLANSINIVGTANVLAGSSASDATVYNSLTLNGTISGTGNLIKSGNGTVTLGFANTYSGGTTFSGDATFNAGTLATSGTGTFGSGNISVSFGTLTLGNNASIADTATLLFGTSSLVNLNFTGTEAISMLGNSISSTFITSGTYTAAQLNGFFGGSVFNGTGSLNVIGAIPEPSTYAALAGLAILSYAALRRRRA